MSKKRRRDAVSAELFDAVRALISDGKKTSEALRVVGGRTGRSPGAIAQVYYGVAKKMPDKGGVNRRARRSATASTARARRIERPSSSGLRVAAKEQSRVGDVTAAATALADHAMRLELQNARYREVVETLSSRSTTARGSGQFNSEAASFNASSMRSRMPATASTAASRSADAAACSGSSRTTECITDKECSALSSPSRLRKVGYVDRHRERQQYSARLGKPSPGVHLAE